MARDDPRPRQEELARLGVGDEVELAAALAGLDVGQPVELVGRRAQRLGQDGEVLDAERELAPARAEGQAVDPDEVAEVEVEQAAHRLLAQDVGAGLELDPARAVVEVEEGHPALAAAGVQAAGDAVAPVAVLARGQVGVRGLHLRDRHDAGEGRRERVHALGAQPLELRAAGGQQLGGGRPVRVGGAGVGRVGHRGYAATSIFVILSSRVEPLGRLTSTVSPRLRPMSALPTGDSLESLPDLMSASAEPTIV